MKTLFNLAFLFRALFILIALNSLALFAAEDCRSCHSDMQSSCNLNCVDCHVSTAAPGQVQPEGHPKIIANPSKEVYWQEKCASCHAAEIMRFKNSLHYSLAGVIDQTRFLWGKTSQPVTGKTATEWKELTRTSFSNPRSPADLVDRLLGQKCMTCHFEADGKQQANGRKRAAGCAACHISLEQTSGKPLFGHKMQRKVADETCLTCHSGNRVGADYYGYFEHDYHNEYQTPYGSKPEFATFQHRLAPDVHQLAGMQCTDCHSQKDVMGGEAMAAFEGQNPKVTCPDCHGGFKQKTKPAHAERVPQFDQTVIAHQSFHQQVSCAACHAGWSYQDYGLHLFYDQSNHYEQWGDYLWQDDMEITRLLQEQLGLLPELRRTARTTNKLTGKTLAGAWYKGWTFRRWEGIVLGKDATGRYAPVRPLYQYYITYVDSAENVWLDSQKPQRIDGKSGWSWDVYSPHTIRERGRSCEGCHGNALAAGLGIRSALKDSVANSITLPSAPILPGMRLLNSKERKRLLNSPASYKKWRVKEYKKQGIKKLLHDN